MTAEIMTYFEEKGCYWCTKYVNREASQTRGGIDMVWIILMGGLGGSAVLLLVISYRMTEQSNLAPFSYFGIPLSFVLGWLFFAEAPWSTLFPGGILIAAGGLLIVWRERVKTKNNSY